MTAISRSKYLTAKEWRNNKGLFTKAVTDATGIGKALDQLDIDWNKVPWAVVDASQATANLSVRGFDSTYTVANVTKLKAIADQHDSKVSAVKTRLHTIETLAKQADTRWRANKLVPSASIKYVGQVQLAANTLFTQLSKLDDGWKAVATGAEVSEKLIAQKLNSQIDARVTILRGAAQAMQSKPSKEDYGKMFDSLTELIPLLKMSPDIAHQAAHGRLVQSAANKNRNKIVTEKMLQTAAVADEAQELEAAVRGI